MAQALTINIRAAPCWFLGPGAYYKHPHNAELPCVGSYGAGAYTNIHIMLSRVVGLPMAQAPTTNIRAAPCWFLGPGAYYKHLHNAELPCVGSYSTGAYTNIHTMLSRVVGLPIAQAPTTNIYTMPSCPVLVPTAQAPTQTSTQYQAVS
jgi:hypothetical protein